MYVEKSKFSTNFICDNKKSMIKSTFQLEYESARNLGYSHFEARNKAIDEYRKYESRTVPIAHDKASTKLESHVLLQDDITSFNDLVGILIDNLSGKELELMSHFVVVENLQHLLNKKNGLVVTSQTKNYESRYDFGKGGSTEIAVSMGLAPQNCGYYSCLNNLKRTVKSTMERLGIPPQCGYPKWLEDEDSSIPKQECVYPKGWLDLLGESQK